MNNHKPLNLSKLPFSITYTNKEGIAVTNYGSKHELEALGDHLDNKGISFTIKSHKQSNEQVDIQPK